MKSEQRETVNYSASNGAVLVSSAYIWRKSDDIVCVYVDMRSKYAEAICVCDSGPSGPKSNISGPTITLAAGDSTMHLNDKCSREELTELTFMDYVGWEIFCVSGPNRYTMSVVFIKKLASK